MHRKLNTRISPASLLAMLALFVSLGGVSYAAATIGTSDIRNGAVTKKKLKRNAVSTVKIRPDAVTGAKVKESTLGKVPSAADADHADVADSATDAQQLGGVPAAGFGSGIVGAAVKAPPAAVMTPTGASGSPIGFGDPFEMPVPVPFKIKNLVVRTSGDASRPFVLQLKNGGKQTLSCSGTVGCAAPGPVSFEPGDVLELTVTVLPGPAIYTGATYQVGYQMAP